MKKLALYTFIDAFGWEIYQRYGFLNDILPNARKLETTFGFSSAADPSILTGRYPDQHTHWSSFYYDPDNSPFKIFKLLSILPRSIFDRWRVRHWMSKLIAKWFGYTGYFEIYSVPFKYLPYFDYLEKHDYFVPGGILKTATIFDYCVENEVPYHCSNWRLSEDENLEIAKNVISDGEIEFMYLYLPKLDAVMHAHGNQAPEVEQKIHWLEDEVKKVLDVARSNYDQVSLYAISDHGMSNVTGSVDLISMINKTDLEFGEDYVAMYDSTMARFWILKEEARSKIINVLEDVEQGYIVPKQELQDMHVYFPDHKFGDLFFLMDEDILINPSFMGLKVIPGMHGYHPKAKDSYSFIASNRDIPENINSITDIRTTMETEINADKQTLS